jgi:maleate cis-trans isomerase
VRSFGDSALHSFEAEMAVVSRLATRLAVPVVSTCASAVRALRVLEVERVVLSGGPWFDDEFNDLGAAYFQSQGPDDCRVDHGSRNHVNLR